MYLSPMTSDVPDALPFPKVARALFDTLALGWSRGRVETLASVFADDAVFIETPFTAPLTGIAAIRRWAADIPYHQSETTFTTGEVFVAGPWCSTEFTLVFRRRKTGEWVEARGAMFAETNGERITELRMYWHRWNGARETSLP
jgi:ketosteroid isomerase-like protein